MLRLRLASLALASGLLLTLSGCRTTCEDEGRFFPRLFNHSSLKASSHGECDCHHGQLPPHMMMESAQGPVLTAPSMAGQTAPVLIRDVPASQPPQVFKVPMAAPTPYNPAH